MAISVGVARPTSTITGVVNATPKPLGATTVSPSQGYYNTYTPYGSGVDISHTAGGGVLGASTTNSNALGAGGGVAAGPSPLFTNQLKTVKSSAGNAAATSAGDLRTSILQFLDSLTANQKQLDNQTVQNYLGKQTGTQGVLDMVGRGIRSGGVMLSNKNAADSSAAGAVANAYGQQGRQQLAGINGQFAVAQDQNQQAEDALLAQAASKIRDLPQAQSDIVNSIVTDAQNKLGAIDQQMAYMSLPDRVNMEAEKTAIKNDVLGKLQGLDQLLSSGVQGTKPIDQNTAIQRAGTLQAAGTAPTNAFNFDTNIPAQFQNTGPFASQLPIFTFPGTKRQTA